jgi:hypothetical protein
LEFGLAFLCKLANLLFLRVLDITLVLSNRLKCGLLGSGFTSKAFLHLFLLIVLLGDLHY